MSRYGKSSEGLKSFDESLVILAETALGTFMSSLPSTDKAETQIEEEARMLGLNPDRAPVIMFPHYCSMSSLPGN